MTDAPVDELDDVHPDILAALAYAAEIERSLSMIWFGPQDLRSWLTSMEFTDAGECELIIGAVNGFARAARAQKVSHVDGELTKVMTLHDGFSPHPSLGLPPVTNALSIWQASRNISIVIEARAYQKRLLSPQAINLCRGFIQRILTNKHGPGVDALA